MPDAPILRTIPRQKLAEVFKSDELVRQYEALQYTAGTVLPANIEEAATTAVGAQTVADAAHVSALAASLAVTTHVGSTSDAHDATAISVVPVGSIAATDVQGALAELDSEKVPTSRTVNGKPLSANVTLSASDVGAPSGSGTSSGTNTGDQFTSLLAGQLIGRNPTAGAGPAQALSLSQALDANGSTQGIILYRDATGWVPLAPGTVGQVLKTGGSGANPSWVGTKEMLANVALGSAGTSLASGTIAARKFLEIHIYIAGYNSSDTASLQFNGAAGTAYRYQWMHTLAGALTFTAGNTAVSTDRVKVASVNMTNSRRVVAFISNDSAVTEKLVAFRSLSGTGSAATQATRDIGDGAWISGAATQITSVSLVSSSNMTAGTQMTIYGWN